ncbi:biotin--[acetyl-CoA-carboxylase] ligase [Oscillibacter sp. MSJ-2]|uniref:Bifunctional ligase/repressor BirA n=1 Tax=Dysosmobacter acutus TaxID=2841504 RepID=A0ABS6FBB6_9FIRM|nr:biotin--[acetyl-CoA-carboxylase] ligase [Dysosmobacter acutus]MBU5626604.1 biotin--[acetyl-CoA-carboxylase] ligase [Dysosmobacter acutus]
MSKQQVLALLKEHRGDYVSGEGISGQLGITRTAIWKAVDALRKDGYTVEAKTGLGYRLTETPDALTEAEIRSFLGATQVVGRHLICLQEVDSTNTYAKRIAIEGAADGTVVVSDCQTGGRGRMGRSFQSPAGKGVFLSVLLRPDMAPASLISVTALTAVAMCDAVEDACGIRPQIKWTNDLVLGGKKLCGILTEMSLEGESGQLQYLVIGAGVNVGQEAEDFDSGVREIATSLKIALGREISRPRLAASMIQSLDRLYDALRRGCQEDYLKTYRRDCVTLGKAVQLIDAAGNRERVDAMDVDEQFGLVVRCGDGSVRVVRSGEVSVRGMYGYVE